MAPTTKRILRWGNSYGIRLSKAEVEALGLGEGKDVQVELKRKAYDWSKIAVFHGDDGYDCTDHDEVLYQGWLEDQRARRR